MVKTTQSTSLDFASHLAFDDILTNPILDIAARLWQRDRYEAFQVCYRSMRRIDDLVDNRKESGEPLTHDEIDNYESILNEWLSAVANNEEQSGFQHELLATLRLFNIPLWPWKRLCKAMIYDLTHDGFDSVLTFRRYTEGAAIAPASVFMHLCGVRRTNGEYEPPSYDIAAEARDLATFSYFVHIMRDFEKDQVRNLNYFADNMLAKHALTREQVRVIAESGKPTQNFRALIADYKRFADFYRQRARARLDRLSSDLDIRYRVSLEVIYDLYLQIFERVNPDAGAFDGATLQPSPKAIRARLNDLFARLESSPR